MFGFSSFLFCFLLFLSPLLFPSTSSSHSYKVSAKLGEGIQDACQELINKIVENNNAQKQSQQQVTEDNSSKSTVK
jgi:hypothetical protein